MINGRKLNQVWTKNANEETVLVGEAEVEQPVSTFVFTGQGSQEQGMVWTYMPSLKLPETFGIER